MSRRPLAWAAALTALAVSALGACSYEKLPEEEESLVDPTVEPGTDPTASSTTDPAAATTSTVVAADVGAAAIALEEIAVLEGPVAMASRSADALSALYVAQQNGIVQRIDITYRRNVPSYSVGRSPVLDISDEVINQGEQGLLGLVFSQDGSRLYVAFTGLDSRQHLVEYRMSGSSADRGSRRDLMAVDDSRPNHNGGQLAIGPDGFLYWGMGDGGGGGDPEDTGQDPGDFLGSILRIDPDVAPEERDIVPYSIPPGNPFAAGGEDEGDGAAEVWAYGLRNPWRFSFDRATGDLWIADVGQDEIEEIDFLPASSSGVGAGRGANLGWSELEGDQPYEDGEAPDGAVPPIFTYDRDGGCSVTGGHVYRGAMIPALVGVYVFADYCEGQLRGLIERDGELADEGELGPTLENPTSFGEDIGGELYVLSQAGPVYRIVPAG